MVVDVFPFPIHINTAFLLRGSAGLLVNGNHSYVWHTVRPTKSRHEVKITSHGRRGNFIANRCGQHAVGDGLAVRGPAYEDLPQFLLPVFELPSWMLMCWTCLPPWKRSGNGFVL